MQRPAAGEARETTADPCLTMGRRECVDAKTAMAVLLREYSTEVSPLDRESIAMAPGLLPPGGEVFESLAATVQWARDTRGREGLPA